MLDYQEVVLGLQAAIDTYNAKAMYIGGRDAEMYSTLADTLQTELNTLQGIGQTATQQDLIVAWQALRYAKQQIEGRLCRRYAPIAAMAIFLLGIAVDRLFLQHKS